MAWSSAEWNQGLCVTDCQKGECSRDYKIKHLISSQWDDGRSDAAPDTGLWTNFWNRWSTLGFCSLCFSLSQSYFCSALSGGHTAICVFISTCSSIPVGEASKGDEPEKWEGLWLGLFADPWLAEPPWASLPAGTRGTATTKDRCRTVMFSGTSPGSQ